MMFIFWALQGIDNGNILASFQTFDALMSGENPWAKPFWWLAGGIANGSAFFGFQLMDIGEAAAAMSNDFLFFRTFEGLSTVIFIVMTVSVALLVGYLAYDGKKAFGAMFSICFIGAVLGASAMELLD